MNAQILIAGFGGQGVLFAGELLATCALRSGCYTTWYPSYGPEMRGGTAHCTVVISDQEIGSPVVKTPSVLIAMNLPSLEKYEASVSAEGVIVLDSSMTNRGTFRKDLATVVLPASSIAETLGSKRVANIILIGALISSVPMFQLSEVAAALDEVLPPRRKNLMEINIRALEAGYNIPK